MRLFVRNNGEHNARLLPRRQLTHDLTLLRTTATIATQQGTDAFDGLLRHELLFEKVQWRHCQVELFFKMLCKAGNFEMHILFDLTFGRIQFARHKLDQRCFSSSVL